MEREKAPEAVNHIEADMGRSRRQKDNNFNLIRLLAAIFVFAGHMGIIIGGSAPSFAGFNLHEIGVFILFMIGGYLITSSWLADPHILRYGIRRFLRLWPAFAVMVLIMTFVTGPLLSSLGAKGYFSSWYTWYLKNLRFYIVYAQPGVFSTLPVHDSTNGSLWTMPVEAAAYILTPLLVTILRVRKREALSFLKMGILTVAVCLADLLIRILVPSGTQMVFYGTDLIAAFHLLCVYIIGMFFSCREVRRFLNLQVGCVAVCILFLVQFMVKPAQYLVMYLVLPYCIFSFALDREAIFRNFGKKTDLSYGIYLYGFFFQQLITQFAVKQKADLSFGVMLLISGVPTLLAAWLSWRLIENPAQRLSRRLTHRKQDVRGPRGT